MVNCAECGKKIGIFGSKNWIKEYENNNKKTWYCPDCFKKVDVCAICGKSLKSFKESWYSTDNKWKRTFYCPDCFEKENQRRENEKKKAKSKKKHEKDKFKTELMNDELILRFSEKYFLLCLSLNRLRQLHKLKREMCDDEKLYNKWVDIILSNNLSIFKNLFSLNWTDIKENECIYTKCYEGVTKKKADDDIHFLIYDFFLFDENEQKAVLNFLEIISKRYQDLNTTLLIDILDSKAREFFSRVAESNCDKFKTEGDLFKYILEEYTVFVNNNLRVWAKEYLKILLDCARTKKLTNCKSLDELRKKIKEFQKNIELDDFENKLLKPSANSVGIEDIDVMNGFEFEDFLSKLFKNMGYKVTQTKLSGDQGADLIIERNHKKTVVQAKCYSGKLSNKAIQEVVASIKHYKASAGMVVTNSHFTPSAVKLADSNEVRLIDRNKLKELIEKYMN